MGSAHLSGRETKKLRRSWRETCSASREGEAKEERNCCCGQKHSPVLPAPLTLRREGLARSQCRCERSSHHLENWALVAGTASCSVMGSDAFQVKAEPGVSTPAPLSRQCTWPPTAILLPPVLCSFPCNLLVTSLIKFDRACEDCRRTSGVSSRLWQWSTRVNASPRGSCLPGLFQEWEVS